jgi:hypothetical protein
MKTLGSAALLGATPSALSSMQNIGLRPETRPRIALLYEEGFPSIDTEPVAKDSLLRALDGLDIVLLRATELRDRLTVEPFQLLLTPYGSAFPVECFVAIHAYLARGGMWMNIGGRPLSVPVVRDGTGWRQEVRQISYHRRVGITQTFPVPAAGVTSHHANEEVDGAASLAKQFNAKEFYALYVRFAETKDSPDQDGSSGPRDAILTPLVHSMTEDGTRVAAPIVMIDRLQGMYAGGRWVFATLNGTVTPAGVRTLAEIALRGPLVLSAQPSLACYHGAEIPRFLVRLTRPSGDLSDTVQDECDVRVVDSAGNDVAKLLVPLAGTGIFIRSEKGLKRYLRPGMYRVKASVQAHAPRSGTAYKVLHTNGFWVYDPDLIASAKPLSLTKDLFVRNGKPYPITGTTYMTSDVHRKFLLEPNPYLWSRDFREMKEAGVNMVRTGIWTAWKNYMLDVGSFNEIPLRALDAFLLTARQFDIPVIFTFFAFFPEAWGGKNPYLDPRAVAAQKVFLATISQRYSSLNDITWDLINEPSFSSPAHAWLTRPNYDDFESERWRAWLHERSTGFPTGEETVREQWRTTVDDSLTLPSLHDFEDQGIFEDRKPFKALDYRLFTQDMFVGWVKEMTAALRSNGNARQLITVGQDEGGTLDRPGPQFFSPVVDFTCNHTWWQTDDLVWDSVVTKVAAKPNLIEETGILFSEKMDGSSFRTEEELRNLLERKMAIAAGTGSAGFVQWIWNTSCYNPSDGEATVGFMRVDGTAKPELEPFRRLAAFFRTHAALMQDPEPAQILMIIPHSQLFSVRDYATAATKRCVRVFQYHHGVGMEACSEYVVHTRQSLPRLVVVPAPCVLRAKAWEWLMSAVEQGSILLISGTVDLDEYWRPTQRSAQWGMTAINRLVAQEEEITIGEKVIAASYRGDKMHKIQTAVTDAHAVVKVVQKGKGTILWSPLPLELSDSVEPTVAFYALGLKAAAIEPVFTRDQSDPSLVVLSQVFRDAILCTVVSEAAEDKRVRLVHRQSGSHIDVSVPAQRSSLMFVDGKSGRVVGRS